MASKYDIPASVFDFIYNGGLDVAKKNYATSADALQAFLDNYAANYPSFKKTMAAEGMLNADGSINPKKFMDSEYLDNVKQQASEGLITSAGSAAKNARMNQAQMGGVGSNLQTAGIAKSVGDVARNLTRDYGSAYKQEKETAYDKATDFGSRTQQDAINQAMSKQYALGVDKQTTDEILKQQQPGILQSPEIIRDLVGMGINAAIGNPAGIISSGADLLGRDKSAHSKGTGVGTEKFNNPDYYKNLSRTTLGNGMPYPEGTIKPKPKKKKIETYQFDYNPWKYKWGSRE